MEELKEELRIARKKLEKRPLQQAIERFVGRMPTAIRAKARNLRESWEAALESCLANFRDREEDDAAPQSTLAFLQNTFPSLDR